MTRTPIHHRLIRLGAAIGFSILGFLAFSFTAVSPAYAAAKDQIDSFTIDYDLQPSGVLAVKEVIVWRFGDSSGRHGIKRDLIVREPYGKEDSDAVYDVSNIAVNAEDGVSDNFDTSTSEQQNGRVKVLEIKVGDGSQTISAPTATYTITYDVAGAMRTFPDKTPPYDEFSWDATGSGFPLIKQLAINATVPGGAQELTCFAGPISSKDPCTNDQISSSGVASFTQSNLQPENNVSIGVKIDPGLVSDNKPHLETDASQLTAGQKTGFIGAGALGLASLVGAPLIGSRWWRKNGRDQRYAGLAPGMVPLTGQSAQVVPSDPDLPIPVAFSPPKIPVAEAGLLIDGQVDTRETAATIIALAVAGALRVESEGKNDFRVTLLDPSKTTAPHEMVLLTDLFSGQPPGTTVDLSTQGSMLSAHTAMREAVRSQVTARGWFREVPSAKASGTAGFAVVAFGVFGAVQLGAWVLWLLVPLLPIIITIAVIRTKMRRGQRTADGRAMCDQVEGFKTYLATAEADQLRFEEGEDIFSRYLPWAIAFDLADRWAKICARLVELGRLPDTTPYWYVGSYHMSAFNAAFLTSSLATAATPVASTGSSGSGFGGGSSFGGGGFSGGGGGGGGGSSW